MLVEEIVDAPEHGNVLVDLVVRSNIDDRVAGCRKAWCQAEPVSINPRTDVQNGSSSSRWCSQWRSNS